MEKKYPLSRQANIVVQELDNEVLIYDLNTSKAFCLNETSSLIWQSCDGTKSIPEIVQILSSKLDSPASEDLVWLAIDQLRKENLIENQSELISPFAGMSRRSVIKKVALSSMIALPIIASIVSPNAVHAASVIACTCPNGQAMGATSCTDSPQCMAPTGTCSGVTCNGGGNNCGTLNGMCV